MIFNKSFFKKAVALAVGCCLLVPFAACSTIVDLYDDTGKSSSASKAAESYIERVLEQETEDSKEFSAESENSDVILKVLDSMPLEQRQIVDVVLENTEYKVCDFDIDKDDDSAQGIIELVYPDLPALLESGENFTQESFLEAIPDAYRTSKALVFKLDYVDHDYLVSTETVGHVAEFLMGIGFGEEYYFDTLNDGSAIKLVQDYIAYFSVGDVEAAMEISGGDALWDNNMMSDDAVRAFYQTYYSQVNCACKVIERTDDTYVIQLTGVGPDIDKTYELFMDEEYLVRYHASVIYDIIYSNKDNSYTIHIFYDILDEILSELEPVEKTYEVTVKVRDDELYLDYLATLEPTPSTHVKLSQLSESYQYELFLKGLDYLYERRIITDVLYDPLYEEIERLKESSNSGNGYEYLVPYVSEDMRDSYCESIGSGYELGFSIHGDYEQGDKFYLETKFDGEAVGNKKEATFESANAYVKYVVDLGDNPSGGTYRFKVTDESGKTICISTLSVEG